MELKHYLSVVLKRKWLICTFVMIITALTAIYNIYMTSPLYQAQASLLINEQSSLDENGNPDYGALQANIILTNTYKEVIRSVAILNKVNEKHPDLSVRASNLSVSSADQSQVIHLVYIDSSYKNAAATVNAIAEVFQSEVSNLMHVKNVTVLNLANENINANQINSSPLVNTILAMIVSLLLAIGLVFLLDYLDDTYRSERDIEEDLGIPLLVSISNITKNDLRNKRSTTSNNRKIGEGNYATLNN